MSTIYGYCRVNTAAQNVDQQINLINRSFPEAFIITESEKEQHWNQLMKKICPEDTIVFEQISCMSDKEETCFQNYKMLYAKKVNLVFLQQPYLNTQTYRKAFYKSIQKIGDSSDGLLSNIRNEIIDAINDNLMILAQLQIFLAFERNKKEDNTVKELKNKTEKLQDPSIHKVKFHTKKSDIIKAGIQKYSKSFNGSLTDLDCIKLLGCARNTYYKYKRVVEEETDLSEEQLTSLAEEKKLLQIWGDLHQTNFDELINQAE